jgi:hypothetical protein
MPFPSRFSQTTSENGDIISHDLFGLNISRDADVYLAFESSYLLPQAETEMREVQYDLVK